MGLDALPLAEMLRNTAREDARATGGLSEQTRQGGKEKSTDP